MAARESGKPEARDRRQVRHARPEAEASINTPPPPPAYTPRRRSLRDARSPAAGNWRAVDRKADRTDSPPLPPER
ncbi:Hypothetical predicted protein [Marmota monax]|uniref:Uncharacterized protein n=1 Tax=Marmota monax TaxID=9995 RepID=A0A5E4D700_MARMO|nr:hypothetical protein GHT09_005259 [Marmota monax]VTJ88599.1 Hypothetical predicted protein [Marmota monax]